MQVSICTVIEGRQLDYNIFQNYVEPLSTYGGITLGTKVRT